MEEVWKDIEGYEGLYKVSNYGRVKSLNYKRSKKEKALKPRKNKFGYLTVILYKNTNSKTYKMHRLVAQAFLPNKLNLKQVNHIDEDKENNNINNLEWCTNKYNCNYGTHTERLAKAQSFNVYQYDLQGKLIKIWDSAMECGRNGFDVGHVCACCRNERKTHKGYIWSYTKLQKEVE